MTFVVPFDGSGLSQAALVRAGASATVLDEDVLAVTVVPKRNADYAANHGRIDRVGLALRRGRDRSSEN